MEGLVVDAVFTAPQIEHVGYLSRRRPIAVARLEGEADTVIGEHGMDLVGDGLDQRLQEGRCCTAVGLLFEPGEGELGDAVDLV